MLIKRVQDDGIYVCGLPLFPDGHKYHSTIIVRMSLSDMESTYYASKSVTFPDVCFYCGERSGACLSTCDKKKELKTQFAKVRPICTCCIAEGKEPVTWGPQNVTKKKK